MERHSGFIGRPADKLKVRRSAARRGHGPTTNPEVLKLAARNSITGLATRFHEPPRVARPFIHTTGTAVTSRSYRST